MRQSRDRQNIKRSRSYVDPALVDYLLSNPDAASPPPRQVHVEFLIALVADDDLSQLPAYLAEATKVLRDAGAWLDSVSGSLLFATFRTFPQQAASDPRRDRENAATRLREQLGVRIRIVQGSSDGIVGDLGSREFSHFGSCLPRFSKALALLASLVPGEVRQLSKTQGGGDAR